jgi:pyruvate/2-oxoglutarate dehydrogenase complex dihydrolipoamide dehydrogenase (E3) component
MEAAHIAARRGHDVTLVERESRLGGQLPLCAAPPFKHEISRLTRYLTTQIARHGVRVRAGTIATDALIDELQPEAIIVATGVTPAKLPVPGAEGANVVTAWDVLSGAANVGRRVAVVGGGAVGVETALFLATRDTEITIVEMLDRIAAGESPTIVPFIDAQLAKHRVRVLTRHRVVSIEPGGVRVTSPEDASTVIACDTVVIAAGTTRNPTFVDEIHARGIECHVVGDCSDASTGTLAGAMRDGFWAGMKV